VRITTLAEYGVICALHLARRVTEGPVTGRAVAARERLPVDYVEQILLRLRRAGIVTSTRGARGGYALARSPEQISVRDVIAASELTTFDLHCVSHPVEEERCSAAHNCSIRPVWMLLQRRIDDVLEGVRLADLLHEESVVRTRVGLDDLDDASGADSQEEGVAHGARRAALPVLP
jgi:Rrf2 family protein